MLWVHICTLHLTVCSYHVTYAFESESTLYSCVRFKELLAGNRRGIWSFKDCNETPSHNHLFRKRTTNRLAKLTKWLGYVMSTYLDSELDCMSLSWIHSETRTWRERNIQPYARYRELLTTQLNHSGSLGKWLDVCLWTNWLWVWGLWQSLKFQILRVLR